MKASTKRRIIYWLIKFLKYQETYQPFIVEKRREIQAIHWQNIYNQDDWKRLVEIENMLKYHAISGISKALENTGAIDIKFEPDMRTGGMKVHAILKYILP